MKRREILKGGVAAAAAAGASTLAAPAIAQERIEIAMVATWPRDFPGLGTGAQRFAQRLIDMSDGRFQVEYFAAGERVGAFDSFDEVASGNAQIYHAADYYWKGKHPGWALFHRRAFWPHLYRNERLDSIRRRAGIMGRACRGFQPEKPVCAATPAYKWVVGSVRK